MRTPQAKPLGVFGRVEWHLLWALQCALVAGCLEWLTVALSVRQLANIWELQWGSLWLLPAALLLGGAGAVAWAAWWLAWLSQGRRWWFAHALWLAGIAALAVGVSSGRHFEIIWRRALFVGLCAAVASVAATRARPWLRVVHISRPRATLLATIALAGLFELINRWVLVRLYPAFHLGLAVFTWGLVAFVGHIAASQVPRVASARTRNAVRVGVLGLTLGCLASLAPAALRLSRFDNFRWSLLENAPLLGRAVLLASWIAPPQEPSAETEVAATASEIQTGPSAKLEGRDVLLITVDALRADHVGAYGYERPTTPNLDALAKSGVRFDFAYCATPHTSYSLTSLLTGKYIRPLLRQGAGADSETWASLLRLYGYRTAAFYPPAVFFIDADKFKSFEDTALGFEYQKKEFLEGTARAAQVSQYLQTQTSDQRLFVWVHLFTPHEPYDAHLEASFGDRDVDRYDSEVWAADDTLGRIVRDFRAHRPKSLVIVTADHGEEFGEHGGRYHGTSVYEEQVRVPLVVQVPDAPATGAGRVIREPVQTIDLLPTVLSSLNVPIRPRIRGRDLSSLLFQAQGEQAPEGVGRAYSETDEHTLLAQGTFRLICMRRLGACKLFDLARDPAQLRDLSKQEPARFEQLRSQLQAVNAEHGRFETQGLRAEGKHWPAPLIRGLAGDGDAAADIGELLEDADVTIRRQAAEVLMRLERSEAAAALRLAVQRDEDKTVRRFAALALTRLGEGAPLTLELLTDPEVPWRRRAALVLAETGDGRGSDELVAWWSDKTARDYQDSRDLLAAFAKIRCKAAVHGLIASLDDVRLRPEIATTLARIGESSARGALAARLREEPYQTARVALTEALVDLGGETELVVPLRHWLGVPDPLKGGVGFALRAGIIEHVGGPSADDLKQLRKHADIGESALIIIPKVGTGSDLRLVVRARNKGTVPASLRVGVPLLPASYDASGKLRTSQRIPEIHPTRHVSLEVPPGSESVEIATPIPRDFGWFPGISTVVVVYAQPGIEFEGLVVLPLQAEDDPDPTRANPAGTPGKVPSSASDARIQDPKR